MGVQLIQISDIKKKETKKYGFKVFFELGFRPLYLSAALWSMISMGLWIWFFLPANCPQPSMGMMFWHGHEMLWGFVATVAIAFLLTAGATWTGIKPLTGYPLMWLCVAWWCARLLFVLPWVWSGLVASVLQGLVFIMACVGLGQAVYRSKNKRNYAFPFLLFVLGVLGFVYEWSLLYFKVTNIAWSLVQMGFLCMSCIALWVARRVLPFFASRALKIDLPRMGQWGLFQLMLCGLGMVFVFLGVFFNAVFLNVAGPLLVLVALISFYQVMMWKMYKAWGVPLLWVLYVSYVLLGVGILLAGLHFMHWNLKYHLITNPFAYLHVIGIGGFAVMIMGMMTRTSLGHTGRLLKSSRLMKWSYLLMILACFVRLGALMYPQLRAPFLHISTTLWIVVMGLFLYEFVPVLTERSWGEWLRMGR